MTDTETLERSLVDLVEIPAKDALTTFTTPGAIDPILARVRREIDKFEPDMSTAGGRKAIASFAYRVTQSKTALEKIGKQLADEAKALPKKIDATRRQIADTLDAWRDEVRKPLTEWEEAEDARKADHLAAIGKLDYYRSLAASPDTTAELARFALLSVEAVEIGPQCEEFEAEYRLSRQAAIDVLGPAIARLEKAEAEAAELEALRAEKAKRDAADALEAARKEAAEAATRAAEAAASRAAAEHAAALAAAERRATEAAAAAKAELAAAQAAERAETERREKDRKHKAAINNAVLSALIEHGIDDDVARTVIKAVAGKKIPHMSISY